MQEHELLSDKHWSILKQKAQSSPISQTQYEEWRCNPVTLRLFQQLESELITTQSTLASTPPTDPDIITMHAEAYADSCMIEKMFSWAPEGVELDGDFDDLNGEEETHG
jgi:hypothetical protein